MRESNSLVRRHFSESEPKSTQRGDRSSSGTIVPPRRHNTGFETWRIAVRRVPCDALSNPHRAITSEHGLSNLLATYPARQSLGTTSNPAPGTTAIPPRRISSSRDHSASKTSISPVIRRAPEPPPEKRHFFLQIHGITFHQATLKRCRLGEEVVLVPEPENPHDPFVPRQGSTY